MGQKKKLSMFLGLDKLAPQKQETFIVPSITTAPAENIPLEMNLSSGMSSTPDVVKFYTPTNIAKNQAPLPVPGGDLKAMVNAINPEMNPVAQKYFIPNALTEDRFSETIQPMDQGKPYGSPYFNSANFGMSSHAYSELQRQGKGMDPNKFEDPQYVGSRAAEFFDFKTGKEADRVYGKNATDSQRISIWNGTGRVIDRNGRVAADANNHARKVMEYLDAMNAEKNKPFNTAVNNLKIKKRLGME